jgi:predicted phosphoadenosine phosphosulfate sulfurtransferase
MVRLREYEERDVLEAALDRLETTLLGFDRLAVAFSGGKDSLACLHLVRAAQAADGDPRPVLAFFRDQQHVNESVLDKVREVAAYPWVDLRWVATVGTARTVVLGQPRDVALWPQEARDAAVGCGRLPADHVALAGGAEEVDEWVVRLAPGRVGIVTGIRTAESLIRYRSVVNKISEPWLAVSKGRRHVPMVRPIYDWLEQDVLRYLLDVGERPAALYDAQAWNDTTELRTASLLAPEQMRDLDRLRATDPQAYDALLEVVPEADAMRRYARDLADPHLKGADCTTLEEVEDWIIARFPDPQSRKQAMGRLTFARTLAVRNPHGFPAWWVQHEIARMGHGVGMMPLPKTHARYREDVR